MAGDLASRSPEPHRAGPRQQHRARTPSQAAVATKGQRAGRQHSEAMLAIRLTSNRNARAGRSQRGSCLLRSRRRWRKIQECKCRETQDISLAGAKVTKTVSQSDLSQDWPQEVWSLPSILEGGLHHLGGSSLWTPSSPSLFQSARPSLGDKTL